MIVQDILTVAFGGVMTYLAPIVLILGGVKVAESLILLIINAFDISASGGKRRDSY